MKDITGQEVNIGDKVYIAHGKMLYEAVFSKETKTSWIIKTNGQDRGYSIPKFERQSNPLYDYKYHCNMPYNLRHTYSIPQIIIVDISQEPCKRIIKIC